MASIGRSSCLLEFLLVVVDIESLHPPRARSLATEVSFCFLLLHVLFDIAVDKFRDHLDITAAEREHSDCIEDGEAHRLVFGAVRNGRQIQELGSGAWRTRLDQHVVAEVESLQRIREVLGIIVSD